MPACPIVSLTFYPIQEAEATPPHAAASGGTEGDVCSDDPVANVGIASAHV